jgi:hypothetical protein
MYTHVEYYICIYVYMRTSMFFYVSCILTINKQIVMYTANQQKKKDYVLCIQPNKQLNKMQMLDEYAHKIEQKKNNL